jgi:hypothetical protein
MPPRRLSPRRDAAERAILHTGLAARCTFGAVLDGAVLTVKIRQPSHEFTFGVGMTFVSYSLVLTPVV